MAEEILLLLITDSWSIIHYASESSVAQRVRPLSSLLLNGLRRCTSCRTCTLLGNIGETVIIPRCSPKMRKLQKRINMRSWGNFFVNLVLTEDIIHLECPRQQQQPESEYLILIKLNCPLNYLIQFICILAII